MGEHVTIDQLRSTLHRRSITGVMFGGGHVYPIFIPWSYLKWYPKVKGSWDDTRETISQCQWDVIPGLYPDLSSHPPQGLPERRVRWRKRGALCDDAVVLMDTCLTQSKFCFWQASQYGENKPIKYSTLAALPLFLKFFLGVFVLVFFSWTWHPKGQIESPNLWLSCGCDFLFFHLVLGSWKYGFGGHGGVLKVQWLGHLEFHKMEESCGCESSSWKKTTVSWNFFALCFAYGLWTLCWLWNKFVFLSRAQIKMTSSSCCASKVYNLLEGCVKGIEQLCDAMGPVSRGVLWVHSDSRKVLYLGPTGVMIGVWSACPFFPLYSCNPLTCKNLCSTCSSP